MVVTERPLGCSSKRSESSQIERPALAEPKIVEVFPVHPFVMDPPPVEPTPKIPDLKTRKVAIPDPTPEDLEPIREVTEFEPELYQEESEFVIHFPASPPPPEPEGPIVMTPYIVAPAKIYAPAPRYTEIARTAGTQGVVIVQAVIDRRGQVTSVKLLKGLPMGLDRSALETVQQWRFEAATLNGKPVSVFYTLTIHFNLS
jgi:TonB family protein